MKMFLLLVLVTFNIAVKLELLEMFHTSLIAKPKSIEKQINELNK